LPCDQRHGTRSGPARFDKLGLESTKEVVQCIKALVYGW
jgi:hypothetical protein